MTEPKLPRVEPGVAVWGEPTWVLMAVCTQPFERDGSVQGDVLAIGGGSAYATAIGCSHLGVRTTLTGPFGEDAEGSAMLENARRAGVVVNAIPAGESRTTVIVVDTDGARGMVSKPGGSYTQDWTKAVTSLGNGGVVHASMTSVVRGAERGVLRLLSEERVGRCLSLDAGSAGVVLSGSPDVLDALRPDVIFANEDEASALRAVFSGREEPWDVLVEKTGPRGAVVHIEGSTIPVPVPAVVRCVDSTGAGDAFAAGFIAAWQGGCEDPAKAVLAGHTYAARAVAKYGTTV